MANVVGVLSVNLETRTASFTSGMADAAKSARTTFNEIKRGAGEMGGHISGNMFASRHAIMAVSEAFGTQMPRAITALLVHIGPLGAALEAAFPFAAIALAAVLLIQHLSELHAAGEKLTDDQLKFGTAVQTAFNSLDEKLLQAGIKTDELHHDHLDALKKQLELIDKQSMDELIHAFEQVSKEADVVFGDLQNKWYKMGIGSDGAKHALESFQTQYDSLLAQGKNAEALDLLKGTKDSAEKTLAAQKAAAEWKGRQGAFLPSDTPMTLAELQAFDALKAAGVGYSQDEVKSQRTLVDALTAQVGLTAKVNALKKADGDNAGTATGNAMAGPAAEAAKEAAEHQQKMAEMSLEIQRNAATAFAAINNASISERLATDKDFTDKKLAIELTGNRGLIAALNKTGEEYNNQLKTLKDKAAEITEQHAVTIAALQTKATEDQYREDLQNLEQGEREKIEATDRASAERIAAIDAALTEEQAKGQEGLSFYRELENQRIETIRQAQEERAKLVAEAGKESAANAEKMGELALAATREKQALMDSARRMTLAMQIAEEVAAADAEYAVKREALQKEQAALDKGSREYENKLKELQNKERQLIQAHENEVTAIEDRAAIARNEAQMAAMMKLKEMTADGLTQVLMGHQSFASMMDGIGNQVVSGMMRTALMSMMTLDMSKERQAAAAARDAYVSAMTLPFPVNVVAAPAYAAASFAAVMAFESGGIVPGIGRGDVVPAMLSPGEGIIPGGVMDGLNKMARSGGMQGGHTYHLAAHFAPVIHAVDATGVDRMLTTHGDRFRRHFESEIRKMNR